MKVKFDYKISATQYVKIMTGKYLPLRISNSEDELETIHEILKEEGIETEENPIWDFPLGEIDEIVENDLSVVLVDCFSINKNTNEYKSTLRWFEVN